MLLADWGMTARDIRRQVAAAKAKAAAEEKRLVAQEERGREFISMAGHHQTGAGSGAETGVANADAPAGTNAPPSAAYGLAGGAPAGGIARASIIDGIPRITVSIPGGAREDANSGQFGEGTMNRLGGPKPHSAPWKSDVVKAAASTSAAVSEVRKQKFLRGAHEAACRIFGTVLGPEANNAHRNHFHVDLAERTTGAFCQ
ncbi:MAG: extensin family protein [Hyphomicrobiaceae bacterium]|nr:extensin family protein [Hyphomicrobiaceae bacterium]